MKTLKPILSCVSYAIPSLILFILFPCLIFGQSSKTGHVITNNGDTLSGEIKFVLNEKSFDIEMTNVNNQSILYTPEDIVSFNFGDSELYESLELPSQSENDDFKVFVRCLIRGEVTLYSYIDDLLKSTYYINKSDGLRLLSHGFSKVRNPEDNRYYSKEDNSYKGELTYALNECPTLQKRIRGLKYKEGLIRKVVLNYYKCTNKPYQEYFKKDRKTAGSAIGIGGIVGVNQFASTEEITFSGNGFNIGGYFNYYIPKSNGRTVLQIEALYKTNYKNDYKDNTLPVTLSMFVKRNFSNGKNKFSTRLGVDPTAVNRLAFLIGLGYDRKISKLVTGITLDYEYPTKNTYLNFRIGF